MRDSISRKRFSKSSSHDIHGLTHECRDPGMIGFENARNSHELVKTVIDIGDIGIIFENVVETIVENRYKKYFFMQTFLKSPTPRHSWTLT